MGSKHIRKAQRGQFVVAGAVMIGILVMGVALAMTQLSVTEQGLAYKPVKETILTITSDLDRALAHALSAASLTYNETYQQEAAGQEGYRFVSTWIRAVLTAYSNLGLEMKLRPAHEGYTDVKFLFDWGSTTGLSYAATKFMMNATALGFTGWTGDGVKAVVLAMNTDSITIQEAPPPGTTTLTFHLSDEIGAPISNLAVENLRVLVHLTGDLWLPATNLSLNYGGAGVYTLTMAPRLNDQSRGIILAAQTPEDHVLVQAYYLETQGSSQTFQSEGLEEDESNEGTIQVGDLTLDDLAETTTLPEGTYAVDFTPPEGYVFVNWTTTGDITVQSPYSDVTTITVSGSGTITAFYQPAPPEALGGSSEQVGDGNPSPGQLSLNDTEGESLASGPQITYELDDDDDDEYIVTFNPELGTIFLYWESEGNVTIDSPFSLSTNVTVGEGGGNVTAVYQPLGSLSLSSREENGESSGLGELTLRDKNNKQTLAGPTSVILYESVEDGDRYTAVFAPQDSYIFLYWETVGNVTVQSPTSPTTRVDVGEGGGAVIAVYRHVADVELNSEDWEGLSVNQGWITFNGTDYLLPKSFNDIDVGTYTIAFTPQASDQTFLWWDTQGDVIIGNSTSASTYVRVDGDCNITAVYVTGLVPQTGPPDGPWDILYVDNDYTIVPVYLWSMEPGKLAPSFSMGNDKLATVLYSPLVPKLSIAQLINVSVIVRPNPPNSVKEVYVELGYVHEGEYYQIGNETKPVSEVWGVYTLRIDPLQGDYVNEPLTIPEGSVIQLEVVLTFYKEYSGWGTFFLYHGYIRPSCVELGGVAIP